MSSLSVSIIVSSVFYLVAFYMSYVSSFLLYHGIRYRLISPIVKAASFIIVCYISIISDVWLYSSSEYYIIIVKNGLLALAGAASLLYAKYSKK